MSIMSASLQEIAAAKKAPNTAAIRTLIARHLDVDLDRVRDEAHFVDDLGADWLDRIELIILVEDHFTGLEIADTQADQFHVVGDLIRYIERWIISQTR